MLGYKGIGFALFVVVAALATANASELEERDGKLFPIFQVVKFGNNECNSGGTRNGTCYTSQECTAKGGQSSGSCASGYGVCCVMTMGCGTTSNMNNTYLVQESITDPTGKMPCTYKVCKCGDDICRIRLDFTSFSIAGPSTATTTLAGAANGDCTTDSFTVTSPGNQMPPVICGQNTGQHMILDASDMCHELSFNLAGSTSRNWDIKVTQFTCGQSDIVGPDGCLQYFMGTTGTFSTFNWQATGTAVSASSRHLSNQDQTFCFRQEAGYCSICFYPELSAAAITSSFGLGLSGAATIAQSISGDSCTADWLEIPGAQAFPIVTGTVTNVNAKTCGRIFTSITTNAALASICTQQTPFQVRFVSDGGEVHTNANIANMANDNEIELSPAGDIGFSLQYKQIAC